MKRIASFIFLISLFMTVAVTASGQKSDFQGTWKLDRAKSTLPTNLPTLIGITISIKADSLFTERVYESMDGQEYPFTENLTLDGKESSITIYDMPRKAKAGMSDQEATIILESTTTFNGPDGTADFVSKETWKVDKTTNILSINFANTISGTEENGVFVLNKTETVK
jgi:hypothetical protein